MKLSEMRRSVDVVEQGEWIGAKYGSPIPGMGELCLKVRGDSNSDWRKLQSLLISAIPQSRRMKGLSPKDNDRITGDCIKKACLLDWEGIDDDSGTPLPYSDAKAAELIDDPQYPDLRAAVLWAASIVGKANSEASEATAKN